MPSVISGDANVSATEFGYLDGVTSALQTQMDSKLPLAGGKILQIVRATDSTNRTTTSTSFVDVTGMSVTITPQKSDSAILVVSTFQGRYETANTGGSFQITDSSNNALDAAEDMLIYTAVASPVNAPITLVGYSTPATTSATTYKLRFKTYSGGQADVRNGSNSDGQMLAIEVSA